MGLTISRDRASSMTHPEISIVVPVFNEEASIDSLVDEIVHACRGQYPFEIIYVDDRSTDSTVAALLRRKATTAELRVLCHDRQSGQSRAIYHGVQFARAPWIVTLDGDGQNDQTDITVLLSALRRSPPNVKLVCGWRVQRRDTHAKRWASRCANALRARLLHDNTPDTGCGLKLFERAAFLQLPYFDHMHRYLPALMQREGWQTSSVPVTHRHRTAGVSKYTNIQRALVGIRDLYGVTWLIARRHPVQVEENQS